MEGEKPDRTWRSCRRLRSPASVSGGMRSRGFEGDGEQPRSPEPKGEPRHYFEEEGEIVTVGSRSLTVREDRHASAGKVIDHTTVMSAAGIPGRVSANHNEGKHSGRTLRVEFREGVFTMMTCR